MLVAQVIAVDHDSADNLHVKLGIGCLRSPVFSYLRQKAKVPDTHLRGDRDSFGIGIEQP